MARPLRQSTSRIVTIGPFVAVSDGFTPITSLTLSAADEAEIVKDSTSATTSISGNTWSAITSCDGHYALTLTSGDTSTVGHLRVAVNDDSVCLPVFQDFYILEEAIYDALFAASAAAFDANQDVTVGSYATGAFTSAAWAAGAITSAALATTLYADRIERLDMIAAGGAGELTSARVLNLDNLDASISTRATSAAQASQALSTQVVASAIAAAVLDEAISAHVGAGSTGDRIERLDLLATGGGGELTSARTVLLSSLDAAVSTRATSAAVDAVKTDTAAILDDTGTTGVIVNAMTSAALDDFFSVSASTYSAAVAGSVVKEIADNAGGSSLTVSAIVDGMFTSNGPAYSAAVASSVVKAIAVNAGDGTLATSAQVATRATSAQITALATSADLATKATSAQAAALATSAQAGAIQTKTDQLTFTVANQVDANLESVNGTTVTGSGTSADPWGP